MRAPQIGFPQLVQDFFLRRLVAQRGASARTVEAYRDAFELLLGFAEQRTGKPPSALQPGRPRRAARAGLPRPPRDRARQQCPHPQRPPGGDPLVHALRRGPRPGVAAGHRTGAGDTSQAVRPARARLPHAASRSPRSWPRPTGAPGAGTATRSCSPPPTTPVPASPSSPRLRVRDVLLDRQTAVHLHGKGRKQRVIPLWKNTAAELRAWLDQISSAPDAPVFPNRAGRAADPLRRPRPARPGRRRRRTALPVPARPARHARTRCGTPRPCTCCNRARTWLSSPCGSGIPAPPSRTSTSKPTSPPRKQSYAA